MDVLKNFNFELSDKQIEDKQKLIQLLKENKTIQNFMDRYHCPFSVIENNPFRFKDWLESLQRVNDLSTQQLRENPHLGAYVNLIYDDVAGVLLDEYKVIDQALEVHLEKRYLNQYAIFPLSKSLQTADFNTGVFKKGSLEAQSALIGFTKDDVLGYYIHGDLGVGKSYLAACVTNMMARSGSSVAFVNVAELLSHLKRNFAKSYEVDYTIETLKNVDIIVLDDLGAEPISAWGRDEVLLPLLNYRLENYKKTLFTSNYPMTDLENLYAIDQRGNIDKVRAKRFVDRIYAISESLAVIGENRRHNRK